MKAAVCNTKAIFDQQNAILANPLPYAEDTSVLKKGLTLGSKHFPNRLVCQAMEGCDGTADGRPGELTIRRYRRLAAGGAGLIWFEATAVLPEGRANPRQLYMSDQTLDSFRRIVWDIKETALKETGREPTVIMQATHSGRYSKPEGVPAPLIAYNNPIFEQENPIDSSRILSDSDLDRVGEALIQGAVYAERAGFDGVDIKCCHRYLNCELLSAYERPGRYGGSLENRSRLLLESVRGAKTSTRSDFIVTTRMNAYDGFPYPYGFGVKPGGDLTPDYSEAIEILRQLQKAGVGLVDITMGNPYFNPHVNRPYVSGGYEPPEAPIEGVARMLEGTKLLKQAVPELLFISSALTYLGASAPHVAAAMIEQGDYDFAGFGRMILAYPDFANDILKTGELTARRCCVACGKCTQIMRAGGTPGCVIHDREVYGPIFKTYVEQ